MLRAPLRLLRIVRPGPAATRPAVVRPTALRRPKSSAATPRHQPRLDATRSASTTTIARVAVDAEIDEDDDDMEDMFVDTSMGKEWGGPTRGGRMPRADCAFGDWERKGRATDLRPRRQ